jgi:hypothetical protein
VSPMTQGAASCPWDNGFSAENRRCRIVPGCRAWSTITTKLY